MSARILCLDVETQRAVVEVFDQWPKYIPIDRVRVPTRLLCFAAKFHDEDEVQFFSAWDDDDTKAYRDMLQAAWDLLHEADFVVTWNGNRFDLQWFEGEFGRFEMGPPSPYRSVDLFTIAKRKFGASLFSLKLDWSSRQWLNDRKTDHEGIDLWHEIRYGDRKQRAIAREVMMNYNIHDVELTEKLFDRYLPWIGENFAIIDEDSADLTLCPKCESPKIQKRGRFPTKAYMYQRYWCRDCGSWSKGRRMMYTNELRPV